MDTRLFFLCFTVIILLGQITCTPVFKRASISLEQVVFQLYTRENADVGTRVYIGDLSSLESAEFNNTLPTKIIIHGYMDKLSSGVIQRSKREFLDLEPMNIFGVDWSECSKVVMYEQTIECAKQVGTYAGEMAKWLVESAQLPLENIHLIGHSLGAQAISFASRVIKVKRMSSLDPAGPLFTHVGPEDRIDPTDADFVDVIHTSTKVIGITPNVGHVDFYPNGGITQPECNDIFGTCAHSVAYALYDRTISEANRNEFLAFKCESVTEAQNQTCTGTPLAAMGYGADPSIRGIYFISIPVLP